MWKQKGGIGFDIESVYQKTKMNVAQECAQCGTNYSPEWRKGPDNRRNLWYAMFVRK